MTKIESARMMARAMRRLSPDAPIPVPAEKAKDPVSREAAMDRERIAAALTNVALYAIVVELVIKHLWEQKTGCVKAPYHHCIHELFEDLDQTTKDKIGALYDECCADYRKAVLAGKKQHGAAIVDVNLADLEEAFKWNTSAIKNFKYSLTPSGKTVPAGMMWGSSNEWVLPAAFRNFAIELSKIA